MPCSLNCTEPCQKCYEKVIAGVTEYRCYGQCVVVDAYGMKHLGPGEAAPAGWTLSPEVTEEMAAYTAMYNNQQTAPTSQLDCCSGGPCTGNCWTDKLNPCKCQPDQPPNSPGQPVWKPYVRPAMLDRLTQTTVEEQKAALATARKAANFDRTMQTAKDCCNGGPCDTTKNQCYYNTDGKRACVCHPKMVEGITMPPLPAADGWRPFVPPPPTAQFQTPPAPLNCCRGDKCLSGYQCWRYGKNNNQCQCVLILNAPPLPKPWEVFKDQITPMY